MADGVIGRGAELEVISGFLADAAGLPDALLLEGGSGIGKTTLWNVALRAASEHQYRILACQPVELESDLAFAGLRDLLEGHLDEALPKVGDPQRRALEIAILERDPDPVAPDERAIAFGLVHVFRTLAEAGPLLVAIDDVHWLDQASGRAVDFAVRRLSGASLKVVCTRRTGARSVLDGSLPGERLRTIPVGPLSQDETQLLLRKHLDRALPHWLLQRIHEVSAGNPFFALELGRAVEEVGATNVGAPLPLPDTVADATRGRILGLPESERRVLGLAATLSRPSDAAIRRVLGDATTASLRAAAEAGILEQEEDRLRFTHPILREAATAVLSSGQRRELHRIAADIASTAEERARHLALSADGPDEEIAAEVEGAARNAMLRGASGSAADLAELAATLTPQSNRARRQVVASDYRQASGDNGRAKELVDELVARLAPGPARAEALHRLAVLTPDMAEGTELCTQALGEAGTDPGLRAAIHLRMGRLLGMGGDGQAWDRNLVLAVRLAQEAGDDRTFVEAAQELALIRLLGGRGLQRRLLEQAQARAETIGGLRGGDQPRFWLGMLLVFADAIDEARTLVEEVLAESSGRGDPESEAAILVILAELELRAGNWSLADRHADRGTALAEGWELGEDTQASILFARANVDAHLGRIDAARGAAARGSELSLQSHDLIWWGQNERVLGFLSVSLDDPGDAWRHLGPLRERLEQMGVRTPTVFPILPCAVQALVELGELDEAEALTADAERHGTKVGTRWTAAAVARSRGLIAGARGRLDDALQLCTEAVDRHRHLPYPFELGRSLLALGVIQRRLKHRQASRGSLQEAAGIFEELGAVVWRGKAEAELSRIGGRVPGRGLTPTERRVAELVVEGRTNREVAAVLFVSVRAVEATLSRIYTKLGIRSRTQLAHRFSTGERTSSET